MSSDQPTAAARVVRPDPFAYPWNSTAYYQGVQAARTNHSQQRTAAAEAIAREQELENFSLRNRLLEAEAKLLQLQTSLRLEATKRQFQHCHCCDSQSARIERGQTDVAVASAAEVKPATKRVTRSTKD